MCGAIPGSLEDNDWHSTIAVSFSLCLNKWSFADANMTHYGFSISSFHAALRQCELDRTESSALAYLQRRLL